jgi:hypothetical protein
VRISFKVEVTNLKFDLISHVIATLHCSASRTIRFGKITISHKSYVKYTVQMSTKSKDTVPKTPPKPAAVAEKDTTSTAELSVKKRGLGALLEDGLAKKLAKPAHGKKPGDKLFIDIIEDTDAGKQPTTHNNS